MNNRRAISSFARLGFFLAILSTVTAMFSGLGNRFGLWDFRTGFKILQWGFYGAGAALALSLIGLIVTRPGKPKRGFFRAGLGLLISLSILGVLGDWFWIARHVPRIHDITTDTENPPRFVAVLPLRKNAPNSGEYGGAEIAAQQRRGYPDLGPLTLNVAPDQAFSRALSAAKEMEWHIVEANPAAGRIEATDTTFWFAFKDDIVVRVSAVEGGSRIDVRSVSRVGLSDVGTNARRIQRYLENVKAGR